MQKILDKQESIDKKNTMLQPLYRELKSIIRHMTHTSEYQLLREYLDSRNKILEVAPAESQATIDALSQLRDEYAKLLLNLKRQR